MSNLSRIIGNKPELAEGLTHYALRLAAQGYTGAVDSMRENAPEYIDPLMVESFADSYFNTGNKQETAYAGQALALCVKARPELTTSLTVYGLNYAMQGVSYPLQKMLENPALIDDESVRDFHADALKLDSPKKMECALQVVNMVYKVRPDLSPGGQVTGSPYCGRN